MLSHITRLLHWHPYSKHHLLSLVLIELKLDWVRRSEIVESKRR